MAPLLQQAAASHKRVPMAVCVEFLRGVARISGQESGAGGGHNSIYRRKQERDARAILEVLHWGVFQEEDKGEKRRKKRNTNTCKARIVSSSRARI